MEDIDELQTFVDVASTTVDNMNIQKLNSLRIVGDAVTDFVIMLRKNLQGRYFFFNSVKKVEIDKSSDLLEYCQGLWTCLEKNKQLPSLLVCSS